MKKLRLPVVLLCLAFFALPLYSAFNPAYSDYLFYNMRSYEEDFAYLNEELPGAKDNREKADILWRLSRTQLTLTDYNVSPSDKDKRLNEYQKSWDLAKESLQTEKTADGYHWLASAMGRWGQTKGPLNALGKADEMRSYCHIVQNDFKADMSDNWYVLGVLYKSLPGSISFGNSDYAISYMRRCLDTQDTKNRLNLTNYLELSNQLYDRNWKASKREKEFDKMKKSYEKETVPTEKMKYYEGKGGSNAVMYYSTVPQKALSDRQEAVMLLRYGKLIYEMTQNPLSLDTAVYEKIVARLNEIT
jgi:hypothetical protein